MQGYGDKPDKPGGYGDKPDKGGYGDKPEKPGGYGDKPKPGGYGDKPKPTEYGDKPKPTEYGDKPKPTEYGDKPPEGRCQRVAAEVNEWLAGHGRRQNYMKPCEGEQKDFKCEPLQIPDLAPWTTISWGDSKCDCIESDDTEIMYVTVCNPYSNLTLSDLTIEKLEVVDASGKPPAPLPDGTPCIQLVPIGPYCFGDVPPCSCVTRQFIVRLRAAPGGSYKILLRGICFEACVHGDTEGCFCFEVCPD